MRTRSVRRAPWSPAGDGHGPAPQRLRQRALRARPRSSTGPRSAAATSTELAEAQCAGISAGGEDPGAGARPRRASSWSSRRSTLLMDIELSLQYGKAEDVSPRPQEVAATYAQVDPLIKALPEKYQRLHGGASSSAGPHGRDVMTQVGEQETGSSRARATPTRSSGRLPEARAVAEEGRHRDRPALRPGRRRLAGGCRPVGVQGGLELRQGRHQGAARRRLGERAAEQPEVRLTP